MPKFPDIFGAKIQKQLAAAFRPLTFACVLIRTTPSSSRTTGNLAGGENNTEAQVACFGFDDEFESKYFEGTIVQRGDRVVNLFGGTLSGGTVTPQVNDYVTVGGGPRLLVVAVRTDPARALYSCLVR